MQNIRRTAQGKSLNFDALQLTNEETVAVGNMKVNARGDELGPGGVVVRTRDQVMKEYYKSDAVYTKERVADKRTASQQARAGVIEADEVPVIPDDILAQDEQMAELEQLEQPKLRGNLADAVAKNAKVEQKLLTPKKSSSGPSRI